MAYECIECGSDKRPHRGGRRCNRCTVAHWRARNPARARELRVRSEGARRARCGAAAGLGWDYDLCYLCEQPLGNDTHVDHIQPLSRGGAHEPLNLAPTHSTCNMRKGARTPLEMM